MKLNIAEFALGTVALLDYAPAISREEGNLNPGAAFILLDERSKAEKRGDKNWTHQSQYA